YFETIGKAIIDSFGERAAHVSLDVEMPEMELDVDTAVPIGLITNELVTNALKYAFQEKPEGKIKVSLKEESDNLLVLRISDDGRGALSTERSETGSGFGTMLVNLLTRQLDGKME